MYFLLRAADSFHNIKKMDERIVRVELVLDTALTLLGRITTAFKHELGLTSKGEEGSARDLNVYESVQELETMLKEYDNFVGEGSRFAA
jgi:hypothetical protein